MKKCFRNLQKYVKLTIIQQDKIYQLKWSDMESAGKYSIIFYTQARPVNLTIFYPQTITLIKLVFPNFVSVIYH
jgi:hypothetical protein